MRAAGWMKDRRAGTPAVIGRDAVDGSRHLSGNRAEHRPHGSPRARYPGAGSPNRVGVDPEAAEKLDQPLLAWRDGRSTSCLPRGSPPFEPIPQPNLEDLPALRRELIVIREELPGEAAVPHEGGWQVKVARLVGHRRSSMAQLHRRRPRAPARPPPSHAGRCSGQRPTDHLRVGISLRCAEPSRRWFCLGCPWV